MKGVIALVAGGRILPLTRREQHDLVTALEARRANLRRELDDPRAHIEERKKHRLALGRLGVLVRAAADGLVQPDHDAPEVAEWRLAHCRALRSALGRQSSRSAKQRSEVQRAAPPASADEREPWEIEADRRLAERNEAQIDAQGDE